MAVLALLLGTAGARGETAPEGSQKLSVAEQIAASEALRTDDSPQEEAAREASRTKYDDLSASEALALAKEQFAGALVAPVWDAGDLPEGEKVSKYTGESSALLSKEGEKGKAVLDSTMPLRARDESGDPAPVNLELQQQAGAWQPHNPLVELRIGTNAASGIRLPGSGIAMKPVIEHDREGTETSDRVFFSDVLTDTDMWWVATPAGAESYSALRSAQSPDNLRYRFELPAGAELRMAAGGAAEIARGDDVLATISRVTAGDADGIPVPADMSVEGGELVLHVHHRTGDFKYPIQVDPQVLPDGDWRCISGSGCTSTTLGWAGRNPGPTPMQSIWQKPGGTNGCAFFGYGLCVKAPAGTYSNGQHAEWNYTAPRAAYIPRWDGASLWYTPWKTCAKMGILKPGSDEYAWEGSQWQKCASDDPVSTWGTQCVNGCDWGYGTAGNRAVLRLGKLSTAGADTGDAAVMMGEASVVVYDRDNPAVDQYPTISPWFGPNDTATGAFRGNDPGIGMRFLRLHRPDGTFSDSAAAKATNTGQSTNNCDGTAAKTCPQTFSNTFSVSTATLPEGTSTFNVEAWDYLDKPSAKRAWPIKVDKTAPAGSLSGVTDGQALKSGTYPLTATASDGASGTKKVAITVDGQEKSANTTCSGPSCSLSWSLDATDAGLAEGEHTIAVIVTDQVSNVSQPLSSTKVVVDRTAPALSTDGSLSDSGGNWIKGGENDLVLNGADEGGSGVVHSEATLDSSPLTLQGADQSCAAGSCNIASDTVLSLDEPTYQDGSHQVTARVRDAAGNETSKTWELKLDRTPPVLSLAGTLSAQAEQTLTRDSTYSLIADANDGSALDPESGMTTINTTIDDQSVDFVTSECDGGMTLCSASLQRQFDYLSQSAKGGERNVVVTASDQAGNQTSQSFKVTETPPAQSEAACASLPAASVVPAAETKTPSEAVAALNAPQALPQADNPTTEIAVGPTPVDPQLSPDPAGQTSPQYEADKSLVNGTIDATTQRDATLTLQTDEEPICLRPTEVGANASAPTLENETAAVYANSAPATDTAIRPTATGAEVIQNMRSSAAPSEFAWNAELGQGQQLKKLPDGSVAVVEPSPLPAEPAPDLPDPTLGEQKTAVDDADAHIKLATESLTGASASTPDRVVAVIAEPWAKAADGSTVPATLSASGDQVTMSVAPQSASAYPLVADLKVSTAAGVDEASAAKAASDSSVWTEKEDETVDSASTCDSECTSPTPPNPNYKVASSSTFGSDVNTGPIDSSSDGPEADVPPDAGAVPLARLASAANRSTALNNLILGITDYDPAAVDNPSARNLKTGTMRHLRPAVPYNVALLPADNKERIRWEEWLKRLSAERSKPGAAPIEVNVALTWGKKSAGGDPEAFPPLEDVKDKNGHVTPGYRTAIKAFLDRWGWKYDCSKTGGAPFGCDRTSATISRISAWNEPNYKGEGAWAKYALPPAEQAARYWVAAHQACHPKEADVPGTTGNEAKRPRCAAVVAGEFVGKRDVMWQNICIKLAANKSCAKYKKKTYVEAYHDYLFDKQKSTPARPSIWGFHAYGDIRTRGYLGHVEPKYRDNKSYAIDAFLNTFNRDDFKYKDANGVLQRPAIWLSAVGGDYRRSCASPSGLRGIGAKVPLEFTRWCAQGKPAGVTDAQSLLTILGQDKQRLQAWWLLDSIVARNSGRHAKGQRGVNRVYWFNVQDRDANPTRGYYNRCRPHKDTGVVYCNHDSSGLLGSDDDGQRSDPPLTELGLKGVSTKSLGPKSSKGGARQAYWVLRCRKPSGTC